MKKEYDSNFKKRIKEDWTRVTWDKNFKLFRAFLNKNKRLPISKGSNEELKLYRFMRYYLNPKNIKGNHNKLEQLQKLIQDFNLQTSNIKASKLLWDDLLQFCKTNKRLPNARNHKEVALYHFYYRQTKNYINGKLNDEEINKYIEIKKIKDNIYGN
jgi:hypothetical protein